VAQRLRLPGAPALAQSIGCADPPLVEVMKMLRLIVLWVGLILSPPVMAAHSVTLKWNPNTETNLAGYRLYSGLASRVYSSSQVVLVPDTSALVTNLDPCVQYFFAVTAFTADGLESDHSDEVSYWVPCPPPRPLPPGPPIVAANELAITVELETALYPEGPWLPLTNAFMVVVPLDPQRYYRPKVGVQR
jgi:hypothetical protein